MECIIADSPLLQRVVVDPGPCITCATQTDPIFTAVSILSQKALEEWGRRCHSNDKKSKSICSQRCQYNDRRQKPPGLSGCWPRPEILPHRYSCTCSPPSSASTWTRGNKSGPVAPTLGDTGGSSNLKRGSPAQDIFKRWTLRWIWRKCSPSYSIHRTRTLTSVSMLRTESPALLHGAGCRFPAHCAHGAGAGSSFH